MKRFVQLLAGAALLTTSVMMNHPVAADKLAGKGTAPLHPVVGKVIPGQYIVVLKNGAATNAGSLAASVGAKTTYVYNAALNGFAAGLNDAALAKLQKDPNVAYVEPDQIMQSDGTQYMDGNGDPWGLDRIDQRNEPLSGSYTYNSTGTGVRAYIIDTGIQTSHPEFGGRASAVYDALGGNGQDCNGHGTHVAGTVGGSTYGVAKNAYLRAVRVLDCNGSGATSGIIAGIDWVRTNGIHPAVANMSLGGGYSASLNTAATNLANSGIFLAVAAGNSNADACNTSPASASGTYTVAASDRNDARASFSNYGACVDGYGPGVAIKSAWLNSGTNTISGTSMATPHVVGAAALYKSTYGDAASSTIVNWFYSNDTSGVISGNVGSTPNLLLFRP